MLTLSQRVGKRLFDVLLSLIGIMLTGWVVILAWVVASWDTKSNGLFLQQRVGREGKLFYIFKIKTMKSTVSKGSSITISGDERITKSGAIFRKAKIDELPQLMNVLLGSMSLVGPRPDVEGFADLLEGEARIILSVRPGITGPASLKYSDEEDILAEQIDPPQYNSQVIWPDKVKINMKYVKEWSISKDIGYICRSIYP